MIAVFLACQLLAQAQGANENTSRAVQGVVSDSSGKALENAVVQLKDTKSLQIRSFRTGADGSYHFAGLSTNVEYEVKADYEDATSGWKTLSVFNTKKTAVINLKVKK